MILAPSAPGLVVATQSAALDVARLHLLACVAALPANDRDPLGTHDANLLFRNRAAMRLGSKERFGLYRSGLAHIRSESAPFWHWHSQLPNRMRTLSLSTLASDVSVKRGAITAMTLIGARLEPIADASRDGYISAWLEHEATDEVRNAALGYLSAWGRPDDLSAIKKEIERNSYQTRTNASNAFINISLRISVADAIHAVIELQPDSIAILAIHDGRAVDLINYNISPMLMEEIIDMMSIREFRTLGYDELEPLLLSNSTTLRRAIARKIALTFSKKTVSNFLVRYSSRAGEYYYNVIYWLDFGLSAGPIALRNASQVSAR